MSETEAEPTPTGDATTRTLDGRRTWSIVARKDVADAARSWQLYVLLAAFTAALATGWLDPFLEYVTSDAVETPPPAAAAIGSTIRPFVLVVPLFVLLVGHTSIVGERERGRLRILLGLPVSRRDVLLGTFLGRIAVVGGTLVAAVAVNGVAILLLFDPADPVAYAWFAAAAIAFALVFVGLAVGISAASRTRGRALVAVFGTFLLVTFLWGPLLVLVEAVTGVSPEQNIMAKDVAPAWYILLDRAQPLEAWHFVFADWVVPQMAGFEADSPARYAPPGPEPFYIDTWFLALVLLAWGLVPLLVGYWRFRAADIE